MTDTMTFNEDVDAFVLEADGKVDAEHGYGYLIAKRLNAFNVKTQLISLEKHVERFADLPNKPLFISGGMTEVTANVDWVVKTRSFIREIIRKNQQNDPSNHQAIFGICFGAQIIAEAYQKGSVMYLEDPEIGRTEVTVEGSHPIFRGFEKTFPAYTFHYNQIKTRKEFTLLSRTQHKGHRFMQAFGIPKASCFGVQFHPEFAFEEFKTLVKTYSNLMRELNQNPEQILKTLPKIPQNARILYNFVQSISKTD